MFHEPPVASTTCAVEMAKLIKLIKLHTVHVVEEYCDFRIVGLKGKETKTKECLVLKS